MGTCSSTKKQTAPTSNDAKNASIPSPEVIKAKDKPPDTKEKEDPPQTSETQTLQIIVKINNDIIFEDIFKIDQTIKEVYDKIPKQNNSDYDLLNAKNESLLCNPQAKLEAYFKDMSQVELTLKYTGIILPYNIHEAYAKTTQIIGSFFISNNSDTFTISTFNASNAKTASSSFLLEESNILRQFNSFSAFCNGKNKLFISGGERTGTKNVDAFVQIDLSDLKQVKLTMQQLPNLIQARTWHSMIYIPSNYVFIVGGIRNKTVELYDIGTNSIALDSELNEERSECTLCCINNSHLYAFCGFLYRETFVSTIERCNLKMRKRIWQNLPLTMENNTRFIPSFFSVAFYNNDNSVILFGSSDDINERKYNYLFTIDSDNNKDKGSITEYYSNNDPNGVYREKFFIPISDKESVLMPLQLTDNNVYLLNNTSGKIIKKQLK